MIEADRSESNVPFAQPLAINTYNNFTPEQARTYNSLRPTISARSSMVDSNPSSPVSSIYDHTPLQIRSNSNYSLPPLPRQDSSSTLLSPTKPTLPYTPVRNLRLNLTHSQSYSSENRRSVASSSHSGRSPRSPFVPISPSPSSQQSLSEKYDIMSPDPSQWGAGYDMPEKDDDLHNPDPSRDWKTDSAGTILTSRGCMNVGCLAVMALVLVGLFLGYPILTALTGDSISSLLADQASRNLGGTTNSTGDSANTLPPIFKNLGNLVDDQTPESAYTRVGSDGKDYKLMFSDEFETPGRSFYPGDDPYWTANDLHYWATNNSEWDSPRRVTTKNGSLVITLDNMPSHGLDYEGGMVTTWNKFCFTGGYIETNVMLPGSNKVYGLWPAIWLLGNLGRPGYGATLDGMWPYSYDSCDVGTLANQTLDGMPLAATNTGYEEGVLSYLPGQRLSSCTCPNDDDHPGPRAPDGGWVARSAPEIDIFEAQVQELEVELGKPAGFLSQSGQFAPFDAAYIWSNTSDTYTMYADLGYLNTYKGSRVQESASGVVPSNQDCYQYNSACFAIYSLEYWPGYAKDNAYMTWYSDNKESWTVSATAFGENPEMQIGARSVAREPMAIIANLALSSAFGDIDYEGLLAQYPLEMHIDYIRVYQRADSPNIGCNPPGYPTEAYIEKHKEAYYNYNLTTWKDDYKQVMPRNNLTTSCD